jgi:hypothetical protein
MITELAQQANKEGSTACLSNSLTLKMGAVRSSETWGRGACTKLHVTFQKTVLIIGIAVGGSNLKNVVYVGGK